VVQPGGPPLYVGATGPKALRRAARWAVGVSAFDFALDLARVRHAVADARAAWAETGAGVPRIVVGTFFVLGDDESRAADELRRFTYDYLEVFGHEAAAGLSGKARLSSAPVLQEALAALEQAGEVDEVILVPGTTDPRCAELAASLVASRV
jgi:alkanesulfonate monooxygenase SsuD/methylene tetrahydromethanopterin reductase-like flavin-dependent oxidoreductase (luciferase family)